MRSSKGSLLPAIATFALVLLLCHADIPEPYEWLNSGAFTGPPVNASVDPLVAFEWAANASFGSLQVFAVAPTLVASAPAAAAVGLDTLVSAAFGSGSAKVLNSSQLLVDFGVEHASWLEVQVRLSLMRRGFVAALAKVLTGDAGRGPLGVSCVCLGGSDNQRV